MSRFNTRTVQGKRPEPQVGPMKTTNRLGYTYEGASAYVRSARTDLFLRASSSFANQGTYYEDAGKRDAKLVELTRTLAVDDFDWLFDCAIWLRGPGNIRLAPVIIAAEATHARVKAKLHGGAGVRIPEPRDAAEQPFATARKLCNQVCQRLDDVTEMIAYWKAIHPGEQIPKPMKRGLADALNRLMTERAFLRYDSQASAVRIGDALELTHAKGGKAYQNDLYRWAITARHGRDETPPAKLKAVHARHVLSRLSGPSRAAMAHGGEMGDTVREAMAGQWEWLNSWLGSTDLSKREIWEMAIPEMGYMALLRNLRNFDHAGISEEMIDYVVNKIKDPEEVAKSRQLPFRFLSAYLNAPSDNWKRALNQGANHCLGNIPELDGGTLTLVDVSGSMHRAMSDKSKMTMDMAGALFGVALALKNRETCDLTIFGTYSKAVTLQPGASLLAATEAVVRDGRSDSSIGWGTNMGPAIQASFVKSKHQRVVIISDMQAFPNGYTGVVGPVPADVPIYCFNLASYSNTPIATGSRTRVDLGGLSDHTFRLIQTMENAEKAGWPWE